MNPVVKTITILIISINRLIDGLNSRTVEAIKVGFFFVIFVLVLIGGIMGYRSGMENARIKSPPLIQSTNESFEYDIKKEHRGDFSSMLESQLIHESKKLGLEKIPYPAQQRLIPEANSTIIEPEKTEKFKPAPRTMGDEKPIEDSFFKDREQSSVQPLRKEIKPAEADTDAVDKLRTSKPLVSRDSNAEGARKKERIQPLNKTDQPEPSVMNGDKEIIE